MSGDLSFQWLIFLTVLAGIVTLGLVVGALWVYFYFRSRARRKRANLAQQLGLSSKKAAIWGELDGRPVQVQEEYTGYGRQRRAWTIVTSRVVPALDLGLYITGQSFLSRLKSAFVVGNSAPVGDPVFDSACLVYADEPHRAHALLVPSIRHLILEAGQKGGYFFVSDSGIRFEYAGVVGVETLERVLRLSAQITQHMEAQRSSIPVATALIPLHNVWEEYARTHGLEGQSVPLWLRGTIDTFPISIMVQQDAPGHYIFRIRVAFPAPLGLGLAIEPRTTTQRLGVWLGGQDIQVGDPVFSQAFRVRSDDPNRIISMLDEEMCASLMALVPYGKLTIEDDEIRLNAPHLPARPEDTLALTDAVRDVASSLWQSRSSERSQVLPSGWGAHPG